MLFENQLTKTNTPNQINLNSSYPVSTSTPRSIKTNNGNFNALNFDKSPWNKSIKNVYILYIIICIIFISRWNY